MYCATFIFQPGTYDEAFHRLDSEISAFAKQLPGYRGESCWQHPENGQVLNQYYWDDLAALTALMQHPAHQAAKSSAAPWLAGYQVVISQVLACYGDGQLAHPLNQLQLPFSAVHSPTESQP